MRAGNKLQHAGSVVVLLVVLALAGPAVAAPELMTLQLSDFGSLNVSGANTALMSETYNHANTFTGTIQSQVFNVAGGGYLYLYQAVNAGPSVLEVLGVSPFFGIVQAGYLTGGAPQGFLDGGIAPAGATYDATLAQPNVSYNYPSFMAAHVPAGQHTVALYLISPYAPTAGNAYAINSGVAVVNTMTAVPEPATMALLASGLVWMAARRRGVRKICSQ